jgi:MFS transporter, putative metabolite:H+ symporter
MKTQSQIIGALNNSSFTKQHLAFYLVIVFCHFFDGYDIQMMGFVLPGIVGEFKLSPQQAGLLASSVFFGMLAGGIIIGTIADRVGRKYALIFAVVVYGVMGLAAGLTNDYSTLMAIRVIQGFGLGAEVPLVFTYLSEFLPARHRGVLIASIVAFWQASSFVSALLAIYIVPRLHLARHVHSRRYPDRRSVAAGHPLAGVCPLSPSEGRNRRGGGDREEI